MYIISCIHLAYSERPHAIAHTPPPPPAVSWLSTSPKQSPTCQGGQAGGGQGQPRRLVAVPVPEAITDLSVTELSFDQLPNCHLTSYRTAI